MEGMFPLRWGLPGFLGVALSVGLCVGCDSSSDEESVEPPLRVVGYLPTYRNLSPDRYDLGALTHLCIAFANPTGEGSESDFPADVREQVGELVQAAHTAGAKVLASIAGGTQEQGDLVASQLGADKVDAYIDGLLSLIERYGLDGIDVDIEGKAITDTYEPFVKKLAAALPADKLLTAAVATKNGDPVTAGALATYDFVNIMAYDHCSWTDEPCDQASMEGTLEDLEYWTVKRGVPRHKAVLGVPFYGWCWGCEERQTALTYGYIVGQYPDAKTEDWLEIGDRVISLNSAATIAEKAKLAQEYGGVMIWELAQDSYGDNSLLKVIAEAQP